LVEFYFEVIDTGIGIPKEKRESVYENYVQVKEGHGGTGFGLGIVQSFVSFYLFHPTPLKYA
jgi:signal transduction histidine kinase